MCGLYLLPTIHTTQAVMCTNMVDLPKLKFKLP